MISGHSSSDVIKQWIVIYGHFYDILRDLMVCKLLTHRPENIQNLLFLIFKQLGQPLNYLPKQPTHKGWWKTLITWWQNKSLFTWWPINIVDMFWQKYNSKQLSWSLTGATTIRLALVKFSQLINKLQASCQNEPRICTSGSVKVKVSQSIQVKVLWANIRCDHW